MNQTNKTPDRTAIAAAAASGAFAWGCLLTQVVTVPTWRHEPTPEAAREAFRRTGPVTGAVLFPIEAISTGLLIRLAASQVRNNRPGLISSVGAAVGMSGTVALLPAYFARANRRLMDRDQPADTVPAMLEGWRRWNWLRTGLALTATGLTITGNVTVSHH